MPAPRSWDPLAKEYVRRFADELDHKPRGRGRVLDVGCGPSRVLDVGCGPDHVARHLRRADLLARRP